MADLEVKLESIVNEKEEASKAEDVKLEECIKKVEQENVEQDKKIQKSDSRIDALKENLNSHSDILEAILKELKEKDKVSKLIYDEVVACGSITFQSKIVWKDNHQLTPKKIRKIAECQNNRVIERFPYIQKHYMFYH